MYKNDKAEANKNYYVSAGAEYRSSQEIWVGQFTVMKDATDDVSIPTWN